MNWPECSKFPRFVPSYFKNYERENFSDEKTPVFRGFSKRLKIREITTSLKNFGPNGSKKSTTFENLALTFENLACLQKRLRRQKRGKKAAQNEEFVQKGGGVSISCDWSRHEKCQETRHFHSRMQIFPAPSSVQNFHYF